MEKFLDWIKGQIRELIELLDPVREDDDDDNEGGAPPYLLFYPPFIA